MISYADSFMETLNLVLADNRYSTDTKLHAMIAVGDICLAIEGNFSKYLDDTMKSLFTACKLNLDAVPQTPEDNDISNKLRDSILDAFISIIHGMPPATSQGNEYERRMQGYAI